MLFYYYIYVFYFIFLFFTCMLERMVTFFQIGVTVGFEKLHTFICLVSELEMALWNLHKMLKFSDYLLVHLLSKEREGSPTIEKKESSATGFCVLKVSSHSTHLLLCSSKPLCMSCRRAFDFLSPFVCCSFLLLFFGNWWVFPPLLGFVRLSSEVWSTIGRFFFNPFGIEVAIFLI